MCLDFFVFTYAYDAAGADLEALGVAFMVDSDKFAVGYHDVFVEDGVAHHCTFTDAHTGHQD